MSQLCVGISFVRACVQCCQIFWYQHQSNIVYRQRLSPYWHSGENQNSVKTSRRAEFAWSRMIDLLLVNVLKELNLVNVIVRSSRLAKVCRFKHFIILVVLTSVWKKTELEGQNYSLSNLNKYTFVVTLLKFLLICHYNLSYPPRVDLSVISFPCNSVLISVYWHQRDALFIQFIENQGSIHFSSIRTHPQEVSTNGTWYIACVCQSAVPPSAFCSASWGWASNACNM
jgi:hypothetical protein